MKQEWKYHQKAAPKATVAFRASKKTIARVRGSHSRMLKYYRGASFHLTLSKLVNSPFKEKVAAFYQHYCVHFCSSQERSIKVSTYSLHYPTNIVSNKVKKLQNNIHKYSIQYVNFICNEFYRYSRIVGNLKTPWSAFQGADFKQYRTTKPFNNLIWTYRKQVKFCFYLPIGPNIIV